MPAILDEHQQWVDRAGKPLVGGSVYIGDQGADPIVSPQDIFADREFQTPIANPQPIDANGRTSNKIWVRGRYSIRVNDINGAQVYQELDNGDPEAVGLVTLDNVQGATDISASGTPTVTAYVDKEIYTLKTISINGTPVTLDIDEVGPRPVRFPDATELPAGQWLANQVVQVVYNSTSDSFVFEQIDPMSQAEAEAGTDERFMSVSAQRVAQAISAQVFEVPKATSAQVQNESILEAYIAPDTLKFGLGVAKVQILFDGSAATAGVDLTGVLASNNVASLVKVATGIYTINFTQAFANANYYLSGMAKAAAAGNIAVVSIDDSVNPTTGAVNVQVNDSTGTPIDPTLVSVEISGVFL